MAAAEINSFTSSGWSTEELYYNIEYIILILFADFTLFVCRFIYFILQMISLTPISVLLLVLRPMGYIRCGGSNVVGVSSRRHYSNGQQSAGREQCSGFHSKSYLSFGTSAVML